MIKAIILLAYEIATKFNTYQDFKNSEDIDQYIKKMKNLSFKKRNKEELIENFEEDFEELKKVIENNKNKTKKPLN
jgi:hypothetical protein